MELNRKDLLQIARRAYVHYFSKNYKSKVNVDFSQMSEIDILYNEYVKGYIEKVISIVDEFNNTDITYANFKKKYNVESRDVERYIDTVKIIDSDRYKLYHETKALKEAMIYNTILKTKDIITNMIQDGVNNREFDIIDFYQITGLTIRDYKKYYSDIAVEFKIFLEENNSDLYRPKDVEQFIHNKIIVEGKEFNKEEKISIIDYLNSNNIPITMFTKKAALKRIINNTLDDKIELEQGIDENIKKYEKLS